jgi:hypothetical protein
MRWLIWGIFAFALVLWTSMVWVATQLLGWVSGLLAAGQDGVAVAEAMQRFPWPSWLVQWVDPAWLQQIATALVQSWAWLTAVLPAFASIVGWLVPLAWVVWAVVALGLLGLAAALHVLIG